MPKYYHWLMLVAAVLGAVAAFAAFFVQIRSRKPELTVQIDSAEELTGKRISGLVVTSAYKGKPVERLWKLGLTVTNSGDKTLVGSGPQTNLVHDRITLLLPDWATVLSPDIVRHDFDAEITHEGNRISVRFDQWRSKEQLQLSLDVAAPEDKTEMPTVVSESRAIIDGDIVIRAIGSAPRVKQSLLDSLPPVWATPTKILGVACNGMFAGVMIFLSFKFASDGFRLLFWRRKFGTAFRDFVAKEFAQNEGMQRKYLAQPGFLPKEKWKDFVGKPFTIVTLAETPRGAFSAFIVFLLIGLVTAFFTVAVVTKV